MSASELLPITLAAAVPLWIARLKRIPLDQVLSRAEACGAVIAEHGDIILYRSTKEGETADAFNHLAEAIAICSFAPGGITIFDQHFDATHPDEDDK